MTNYDVTAQEALEWAAAITEQHPELAKLRSELTRTLDRLNEPMRVAVTGKIKTGKSTIINALLGHELVATGTEELTYNVNWLRFREEPGLIVHFKSDRPPTVHTLKDLERLTTRRDENRDFLSDIRYVEVFFPGEALKTMDLIDTPGLASYFTHDSQNTLDFLGLTAESLTDVTRTENSEADALLYLFSAKGPGQADLAVVDAFQNTSLRASTPINTIGVLTRADIYWLQDLRAPELRLDPMEKGYEIIEQLLERYPQLQQVFYYTLPVCGLVAFGAKTITPDDFEALTILATSPTDDLNQILKMASRFTALEKATIPVSIERRAGLLKRLGLYGVWRAITFLHEGVNTHDELRNRLLHASGIDRLNDLIMGHFRNRSTLIKTLAGIQRVGYQCHELRTQVADPTLVDDIDEELDRALMANQTYMEISVLRDYFQGNLTLSTHESRMMFALTGKHGQHIANRLEQDEHSTVEELIAEAEVRINYWRRKSQSIALDDRTARAAHILLRSTERIMVNLRKTQRLLYLLE